MPFFDKSLVAMYIKGDGVNKFILYIFTNINTQYFSYKIIHMIAYH